MSGSAFDTIVIGGGHNGLVAGCYLARAGLDVLVVEAAPTVGGMTGSAYLIPEATEHLINFCAGESVFMRLTDIVSDLGLARFGYRELEADPPLVHLHDEGCSIAIWRDPRRTAVEIARFSRDDAEAYLALIRTLDAALDIAFPVLAANPSNPGLRALSRMAMAAAKHRNELKNLPGLVIQSFLQAVDERFRHPVVRDFLAGICGPFTSASADGSALGGLLLPVAYHRVGGGRPLGGTQALPDALAQALRSAGGAIRTDAPIEEILVADGRAVGVRVVGGEEISARKGIIATCDPRTALGTLLPSGVLDPTFDARVAHIPTYADGSAPFKVELALSGRLRLDRHERWRGDGVDLRKPAGFIGGYDGVLAAGAASAGGRIPADIGICAVVYTAMDPSQAPDGQDTLSLFACPMPHRPVEPWPSLAERVAKTTVARAGEFYDGIDELEIGRWVETTEDLAVRMRATSGCLWHVDFSLLRMGPFRPAAGLSGYSTPVPGLYLGGAGSHPGAGISGLPGRSSARQLVKDHRSPRR